jgi:hypothetical protein
MEGADGTMKTKETARIAISRRALTQRINRKLATEGERLRAYRGGRSWNDLGDYYIVDVNRNVVVRAHVDIEGYGRVLGVIAGYETLAEPG